MPTVSDSSTAVAESSEAAFDVSHLVPAPRATRRLAAVVALALFFLPFVLLVSPWRQNIPATGRVVALDPLARLRRIPAPLTGRISKVYVQEGAFVAKDAPLLELSDLDPQYVDRLRQQVDFAQRRVEAANFDVEFKTRQLELLEIERSQAIAVAQADLEVARDKVGAQEQELIAVKADAEQKTADRERRRTLFAKKLVSELDLQKAVAAASAVEAKVLSVTARLAQLRSERRAKEIQVEQIASNLQAKIESERSAREGARGKFESVQKELTEAQTKLLRQSTQTVVAPRDGIVLRVHGATRSDYVKSGETLVDFVPTTEDIAVELWVRGNDAPLITSGREVRLQFEGWPAVQFAGWPAVAVGTFGGRVHIVDAQDDGTGRFRVLVVPDPDDEPWPDLFLVRQGTRANGWVLLEEVSLGYELWRQLNAFPPSLRSMPDSTLPGAPKAASQKSEATDAK